MRTGALSLWDFASPLAFCSHGLGNGKLIELQPISSVYSLLTLTVVGWEGNLNQFLKLSTAQEND